MRPAVPDVFSSAQWALFDWYCTPGHWRHTPHAWERWLRRYYGVTTISRLSDAQATEALARLQTKGDAAWIAL
jgi:hypothetical protein